MSVSINRGGTDEVLEQITSVLDRYEDKHPDSQIDLYRQNSVSVRIRIIDPRFAKMSVVDRHDSVWKYLDSLSEETQGDISMLVLLAPTELGRSMANLEFEDPVPSTI
jgi:hypothetical protein